MQKKANLPFSTTITSPASLETYLLNGKGFTLLIVPPRTEFLPRNTPAKESPLAREVDD